MQHQGPAETAPRNWLRVPKRQREAECTAQTSEHDYCQTGGSERVVHLEQVQNRLYSIDNAVDINSLSQSLADGERFRTEDPNYAPERENLQGEGSDSEENSIPVKNEESLVPHYELFHLEDVLISATASGEAQQSFKQEPQDAQECNPTPSATANNSPSSSALIGKSHRKPTRFSRMRRLCSEKQLKVQRKRNVSYVPPGVEAKGNNADLSVDPDDETCSDTSQHEQIEVPELSAASFGDSGTNGKEANDMEAAGLMANQTPGQGVSNASSRYSLRKRTSAVIFQPSNTGPLPGTSRSETITPEFAASASSSSSVESKKSKPTSGASRHSKTLHFVRGKHPSFKCVTCDKRLCSKEHLKNHLDVIHKFAKSVCPRCSRSYKWPTGLARHERYECGKEPLFACVACDKRFFSRENLKRHVDIVHKSGDT